MIGEMGWREEWIKGGREGGSNGWIPTSFMK